MFRDLPIRLDHTPGMLDSINDFISIPKGHKELKKQK